MVPLSRESGIPTSIDSARVHLPIEGYTAWPQLLRLVAAASVITVLMISFILTLFGPTAVAINVQALIIGLVCVVVFEMVLVRRLIIPMNGDYGRFRISDGRVDLYPLTTMGLSVTTRPQSIPMQDFDGIAVQTMAVKGSETKFMVTLMHPQRANMVRVRSFTARIDAEKFARALADEVSLKVIPATY
jgi:hypothetical protein